MSTEPNPGPPDAPGALPGLLADLPARFRPLTLLGRGAEKSIYLARDTVLDRDVAVAAFDIAALGALKDDLLREARIMARVSGTRHVVTIFDVIDGPQAAFIISQFMPGGDLAAEIARAGSAPPGVARVVQVGLQLSEALAAAHQRGIVHLDVKPSNVLLDARGDAFLGDFGLARFADVAQHEAGALIGTPAYMAPEQISGSLDARCDLYGLGSLLYELLVGTPPFHATSVGEVLARKLREDPIAVTARRGDVPAPLSDLVAALLARDPAARPTDALAVREALARCDPARTSSSFETTVRQRVALPAAFLAEETTAFVGRQGLVAQLFDVLHRGTRAHAPEVIAVAGEPGIGKTRLAREIARIVHHDGGTVLLGSASEDPLIPYQPFVEAVRHYVLATPSHALAAQLGSDAADLARLAPEVGARLPHLPPATESDADTMRYRMFNAVIRLLHRAASQDSLLVVLEDVQWADHSTLRLLAHVLAAPEPAPITFLLTYRATDVGDDHPLAAALAELHRQQRLHCVDLPGLAEPDVRKLIASMTGSDVPPAVVSAIHERTDGNPFFITETVRDLLGGDGGTPARVWSDLARGASLTIPVGVREVIRHRLSRLDTASLQALQAAAVLGREFDLERLGRIAGLDTTARLALVDRAVALAILADAPESATRYRFTHALLRETLYALLGRARRAALHGAVARDLDHEAGGEADRHAADLAHHYAAAGEPGKALVFALRAAEQATARLAYQEAANLYGQALDALACRPPVDEGRRCEILLAQADALWSAGETATAEQMARSVVADAARRASAPQLLARAALAAGGKHSGMQIGYVDEPLIALLEEGLAALGDRVDPLRARVMARLAEALTFADPDPTRRSELAHAAIDVARRSADLVSLADVLRHARWALWGPDNAALRAQLSTEMVRLAEASDEPGLALSGRGWRMVDLMELGEIEEFERELDEHTRRADRLRQPLFSYVAHLRRTMLALLRGRFAEAEAMAYETPVLGERAQVEGAKQVFGAQMYAIRNEQGRLAELEPVLHMMRAQYPRNAGWPAALAYLYSEVGRRDEAAAEFATLKARGFADLRRDVTWNVQMTHLTRVCARLGDVEAARRLYALHLPSAHVFVVAAGTAPLGAAARNLGQLATTLAAWDDAERWFEAALQMNARMGAAPATAHAQADYAHMLRRRAWPGDAARADTLAAAALQTADALGMTALATRLRAPDDGSP